MATGGFALRIGLVGYGVGGRYFHAPFIVAAEGCELVGVVTRSPQRVRDARRDLPTVPVFGSLSELLDAGVDAVTISTPPQTRRELVSKRLSAASTSSPTSLLPQRRPPVANSSTQREKAV